MVPLQRKHRANALMLQGRAVVTPASAMNTICGSGRTAPPKTPAQDTLWPFAQIMHANIKPSTVAVEGQWAQGVIPSSKSD